MADTRLPSPATRMPFVDWAHGLVDGVEFFLRRQRRQRATVMTRAEYVEQFIVARKCNCLQQDKICDTCQHLIKDVFGD